MSMPDPRSTRLAEKLDRSHSKHRGRSGGEKEYAVSENEAYGRERRIGKLSKSVWYCTINIGNTK
jgi:hypothetical protein